MDAGQNSAQRAQVQAIAEVDHVLANAKKELDVLLKTSTPPTKAIATVLVISYLMFLVMPWTSTYLALMPEKTVPCVWNVLTSGFYEMNLVGTAIDVLGVLYLGRTLEPIWGAGELMHFVLIVQTSVGLASFISMYVAYVLSADPFYIMAKFSGFHGVLAGLLVAVRQQLPDERVPVPIHVARHIPELRNKHLPGLYCVGVLAYCVFSGGKHHHVGLFDLLFEQVPHIVPEAALCDLLCPPRVDEHAERRETQLALSVGERRHHRGHEIGAAAHGLGERDGGAAGASCVERLLELSIAAAETAATDLGQIVRHLGAEHAVDQPVALVIGHHRHALASRRQAPRQGDGGRGLARTQEAPEDVNPHHTSPRGRRSVLYSQRETGIPDRSTTCVQQRSTRSWS